MTKVTVHRRENRGEEREKREKMEEKVTFAFPGFPTPSRLYSRARTTKITAFRFRRQISNTGNEILYFLLIQYAVLNTGQLSLLSNSQKYCIIAP